MSKLLKPFIIAEVGNNHEGKFDIAKKLIIKPNAKLSLQSHKFRSEHWIVVDGKTKVIRGDDEFLLKKNDYIFD